MCNVAHIYNGLGEMLWEYDMTHTKTYNFDIGKKKGYGKLTHMGVTLWFPNGLSSKDFKEENDMPEFGGKKKLDIKEKKSVQKHVKQEEKKDTDKILEEAMTLTLGDPKCYVYFDTEFTGLKGFPDLISIGCVDAFGRTFYAEFTDYDITKCGDESSQEWIKENVLSNLTNPEFHCGGDHWTMTGTKQAICLQLNSWLDSVSRLNGGSIIQMVSDVYTYDFMLFMDLISNGQGCLAVPTNRISPCCIDLNDDLAATLARPESANNKNYVPARVAFDLDRQEIAESIDNFSYGEISGEKHNSLIDALHIRAIHRFLWGLPQEQE